MMTDLFPTPESDEFIVTRALSLTQPWASLVAIKAKEWETRSWGTAYRGWIAIHASKGFPNDCKALCQQRPFSEALASAGFKTAAELPVGHVICVARLTDVRMTNRWTPPSDSNEYAFGDYSPNRLAWKLEDVQLVKPMPVRGALSIWQLPRPITRDDLLVPA